MAEPINILDARNRFSELVERARRGEEVVISRRGEPVARLVPVARKATMSGPELADWFEQNLPPASSRRSSEEIEAQILEERASWD